MLNDYDLPAEEKDEEIIDLLHKHYFTFVKPIMSVLGIIIFMLILYLVLGFSPFLKWLMIISTIIIFVIIYRASYIFKNDIYILTNKRIIDIDQKSFFNRSVAQANLKNIQEIKYEIKGLFRTMFNYGNVIVETAGPHIGVVLEDVADPYEIQQKIMQAQKSVNNSPKNTSPTNKKRPVIR